MALIEEGEEQEDEAEILVVTETMPSTVRSAGAGTEGQGALVRNILQAEKALQACPCSTLSCSVIVCFAGHKCRHHVTGFAWQCISDSAIQFCACYGKKVGILSVQAAKCCLWMVNSYLSVAPLQKYAKQYCKAALQS